MVRFCIVVILSLSAVQGFYLQDESEDAISEPESCDAGCKNGGQCFLSSFCICPKGYSGRYCEVSLHEQCGPFSSMTTMEIECVLCICYNGLFTCDVQPAGLCRDDHLTSLSMNRSIRISRTLAILQERFPNIHGFEPMTMPNVSIDDKQTVHLKGYRIVLNHSSQRNACEWFLLFPLIFIYLFN